MFKVTVKGLRGHLTRFVSTFVAILLGVGFLAGTLVLSDTIKTAFNDLFADVNRGTDAYVRGSDKVNGEGPGDDKRAWIDDSLVPTVRGVDGVVAADPTVMANDIHLIDKNGKVIGDVSRGAPHFGTNW